VPFAENENVIQTLAPDRTDEALGKRVLPGAVWRREDFLDPHALHSVPKLVAIEGELAVATDEEGEEPKQVEQEGDHRAGILSGSRLRGPTI